MKKLLSLILVIVLGAGIAVSGTMAYLSDTDSDVNVMTLGNVSIAQHEYERKVDENGEYETDTIDNQTSYVLQPFTQGKALLPIVGDPNEPADSEYPNAGWDETIVRMTQVDSYGSMQVFAGKVAQDKFVTVENTGKSDAYVRTIIAIEVGEADASLIGTSYHTTWTKSDIGTIAIDGVNYHVFEYTYNGGKLSDGSWRHENGILPAGDTSYPNLSQVYLKSKATNEDMEKIDGNGNGMLDIIVLSQAVQTSGFKNATAALDAAFPKGTDNANVAGWFTGEEFKAPALVEAASTEELAAAVAAEDNAIIKLDEGNYTSNFKVAGGKDITIVGNGKDTVLSGQIATTASNAGTLTIQNVTIKVDDSIEDSTGISQTGKSAIAIWGDQTVVCENVTFEMSLADSSAITSWWDTGVGTSIIVRNCTFDCNGQRPIRATGNVTVENCTFNDPYRYAVQLTAKSSTATEMDKAIINFNNNTIVDGVNGKALVYGIQLEGADYGCHDCVINGVGNTIENGGTGSAMYYCECGKVDHDTITWNTEVVAVHES